MKSLHGLISALKTSLKEALYRKSLMPNIGMIYSEYHPIGSILKPKKSRRQIRARGVLFVKDANRHIHAREEEETRKEWKQ